MSESKSKSKTELYEDRTFFGQYLDSTSEKDYFAVRLAEAADPRSVHQILDLGSFDGSLTEKVVRQFQKRGFELAEVMAVEPALAPLESFRDRVTSEFFGLTWNFENTTMENYLLKPNGSHDLAIASHSLYWMGSDGAPVRAITWAAPKFAIVIRDTGVLHQLESKFRPMMTEKKKVFISTAEIETSLQEGEVDYSIQHFEASMAVPPADTPAFKSLVGFLLDLQLNEIDESLLARVFEELNVTDGRAVYGVDIVWNL